MKYSHKRDPGSLQMSISSFMRCLIDSRQWEILSASGSGQHGWWHVSHKPFSWFSQFASEKLVGFVHIKCAQSPKTSAEEGNTWIERDCLERETERWVKNKKKEKCILVTEMPFNTQITYWEMTQGININMQAQLGTFLDTEEGTSEDGGSNPDSRFKSWFSPVQPQAITYPFGACFFTS